MALLLQKIGYCDVDLYESQTPYTSYFDLLKCHLRELVEEPNTFELKADLGRQIISNLSTDFKLKNNGKFTAVTFTSKILAVCNTLEELNRKLAKIDLTENYYIERIGFKTIAQV